MPPSLEVLELRLKSRSADAPDKLAGRLEKAKYELSFAHRFDKIIINDRLDKTFKEAVNIVSAFL
jgi:guanylate kinase